MGDNIKKDFIEIVINTKSWVVSSEDRYYWKDLVNAALNLRIEQIRVLQGRDFELFWYLNMDGVKVAR